MPLAATTLDVLEDLFVDQILGTTPRIQVKGGESWKHYKHHVGSASRTRRFRLIWGTGPAFLAGTIQSPTAGEVEAELRVRADYAATHRENMALVQDDWHQLRDRLHKLGAPGVTLITATRAAIVEGDAASTDTFQVDLTYTVRYMQARG
jgi:hypothetical protein